MKYLILSLFVLVSIEAKVIEAKYIVGYGVFASIGEAKARVELNDNSYYVLIEAKAKGVAKVLSNGRDERYESFGRVIDGALVPLRYIVSKHTNSKHMRRIYHFEHEKKQIIKESYDYYEGDWQLKSSKVESYYAADDLLSLFFNVRALLKSDVDSWHKMSVGAKNREHTISIERVVGENRIKAKDFFKIWTPYYVKVILHQKIFSSKQGELLIALNYDGTAEQAVLKDVLFFGDITGELINKTIK